MTDEEHTLRLVRAQISSLSSDDQTRVESFAKVIRSLIALDGDAGHCCAAMALVGAELAIGNTQEDVSITPGTTRS